jgi:hypothetical protein
VNVQLTLSAPLAGSLNIDTFNNVTSTYNATTGLWQINNASIININRLLKNVVFQPAANYNSNFNIAVSVTIVFHHPSTKRFI